MREARLVGLSQDGKQLILALAETGEEFAVPVDDRLRAALRGDRARLGQLEIQMESALRPRDIQARIRAGESPEAVAAVAQMPMERVMAFAGPVLAERDHIANLAQRASVRRRGGGDAPTRNLGAWVTERLRIRSVDPGTAEWDAWRRDDGRWAVRVSYFVSEDNEKVAMFAYDAPGRYAVPDDDEARWLVGEQVQVIPPHDPARPNERRLTAVADFDLSLAPDHGADSYEAGFEDAISINRDHPRESSRDHGRDSAREADRSRERDGFGSRETSHDAATREGAGREAAGRGAAAREGAGRDDGGGRGTRRVHSVPSPDDEPTLIDVPIEQPPALRPAVRAVERSAQLPVEAAPMAPPEERAAAPENRFTERRMPPTPLPTEPDRPAQPTNRRNTPHPAEQDRDTQHSTEQRRDTARSTEQRQDTPRPTEAKPTESRPGGPRPADDERGESAAVSAGSEAAVEAPAEPKKKPARRGSKRASVPSWDEIMFGKKAD